MFKCKVCKEKDSRMDDLKSEIRVLRTQIRDFQRYFAGNTVNTTNIELNSALSGNDETIPVIEFNEAQIEEGLLVLREQNELLMGDY